MAEPGSSEIPSKPKRKFKPKAPKRRSKSESASTPVSSSHGKGEMEGVGIGPPLAARGYSHAFHRGGRGRGWGGGRGRGRGREKGEGSSHGQKAHEMMGKQLLGLPSGGSSSTKGKRQSSSSLAKEVTYEIKPSMSAVTAMEVEPIKAKVEPTEYLNTKDDSEDDFGQNTSDSADPLRPVDLCNDAYMKYGQSTAPPGSFLRDDGILSPSHMIYVQLPTKMPSRRRPLKPKLEEKEEKEAAVGRRVGRGITTKKPNAVTSVRQSHPNSVYAEEEDVKPDSTTDFSAHGTSMLLNGNESEPGDEMELPFDPSFRDNTAVATGEEDDEMSKYWPSCRIGRLKVYDNGKMVLKMAGVKFDVTEGQPCCFRQEVAAINTKTRKQYAVGEIRGRAVVVPKFEAIYNSKHAKK